MTALDVTNGVRQNQRGHENATEGDARSLPRA